MKKRLFSFTLLLLSASLPAPAQTKITLEDVYLHNTFRPQTPEGFTPLRNGRQYVVEKSTGDGKMMLVVFDYVTGTPADTLVQSSQLIPQGQSEPIQPDDFAISEDESKILFATATEYIYRHSTLTDYWVYDLKSARLMQVSAGGKQQEATFSPDGNTVAFVRDNNIFIKELMGGKEEQITNDGKRNFIINGVCDWVYEEEFSFHRAYQWSPDGKHIAFYRFDESEVPEVTIQYFKDLYPENYSYKYPKVGETNATVSIHLYHLESKTTTTADVGAETDQYIPRILWSQDPGQLCVFRMNRWQNKLELLLADAASGKTRIMFAEENPRYLEIHDDLKFFNNNQNFLWSSERSGYNHLYIGDVSDGTLRQVTTGQWDVTECYGLDEKNKLLYYQSAEVSPLERYVYSISLDGKKKKLLTAEKGWNAAKFNEVHTYFMLTHSTANSPADYQLLRADGKWIRTLEDNAALKEKIKSYSLSEKEFFTFPTVDGTLLNGWIIKPHHFDASKKYPVWMTEYGGPGSQQVTNSGGINFFHQYLAQEGYVVACIDNRGTGARGEEFRKMTYLKLGHYEPIDQIEGAKHLGTLPYIDRERICIFGWSYGGYLSTLSLALGNNVFKAAIAVAPVTDWRFYDSIYTERYMRDQKENNTGYIAGSPVTYADRIKGKYLLIHGLADDNVHYQNSAVLMKKLYEKNVPFDQMTFPDKNHSIRGGNTSFYLFSEIAAWLKKNV